MPNTACENGAMTKLFKLVTHQFQNSNVSTVQRKYFNETKGNNFGQLFRILIVLFMHELVVDKFEICVLGLQFVKQLCVSDFNSVVMELTSK